MNGSRRVLVWLFAALLTGFVISSAAPYEVPFKSGTVTPAAQTYAMPQGAIMAADGQRVHVFLQLEEYVGAGDRARLSAQGIELLTYLPDRAYVASVMMSLSAAELPTLGVRHLSPMNVEYKLHPRAMNQAFGSWSEYTEGRRVFAIDVMPDVTLPEAAVLLGALGCEVGDDFEAAHTLLAAFEPDRVYEVASADFVLFVDEVPPPMDMVNDVVRTRLHVNEVQAAPYNLSGDGVTIMVYDGGMVDSTHADFGDRVHWNEIEAVADHATHVAGTVGGSGLNSGGTYRGMAPEATIISGLYNACVPYCLYESPNDFEDDYTLARDVHNIELTTNSIGANIDPNGYPCEWFGDYESTSRLLDRLVNNTSGEPLIMCFAAGNERGGASCANSSYRCMSVPAGAKNIITVGATTGNDAVASFSSWGPTDDGRIKPEVCATGVDVHSTLPGGGYGDMSGTSMATPATGGTVCLILEEWHVLFPDAPDPLPETMKAILINSTTDIGPAGVDFQTGFGLVNAQKAVDNLLVGGVLENALEVGEDFEHTFTVAAGLTALDVSLAWSDLPAAGNVTPTLINDLNLTLTDPNNTVYLPWRLNSNNPGAPAQTGVDSINVCERVHVASPAAGTWTLNVTGTLNGSESQNFGLSANVALVTDWAAISGQVRNSNQQGIAGRVSVVGSSQGQNTDASGNYMLAVPGNATYPVRAISYGFVPQTLDVTVTVGEMIQNFALTTAQNGTISGTVRNQFNSPLPGAIVSFLFPNATIPDDTADANGVYNATLPGANSYEVIADYFGQTGSGIATVPEGNSVTLDITITDPRFAPAGPDGHGYYCYEATDPGLGQAYDWLEISPTDGGPGTAIAPGTGNDWTFDVTIPFPFRLYGQENTQIRVGADGWVGGGLVNSNNRRYVNQPIPTDSIPNGIIAVFWDDLNPLHTLPTPGGEGDLSYYHDSANGRFIVEYNNVAHFTPATNHVTAQLIIYDLTTRPTMTNDNEFVIQYQSVDYVGDPADADATVGCENYTGTDGLQIVYGGTYDATCRDLAAETTLRFTTGLVTGFGSLEGQLTMIPEPADWSQVDITFGPYTIHPGNDGSFGLDDVIANTYVVNVTYAGYEGGTDTVVVTDGGTATTSFELYRLDPARSLAGSYDGTTQEIDLIWNQPAWSEELPGPAPQRWDVAVSNFQFNPSVLNVVQGDTVVWTNTSGFHNVHHSATPSLFGNTAGNAPWTYTFVVDLPVGSYPYLCEIHPGTMTGTLNVAAPIRGGGHHNNPLDSFTGYQVWRGGVGVIATVQDTTFTFDVVQSGNYNFWIKAVYEGGDADTSNHYRVSVDLAANDPNGLIPTVFYLSQNYPNPFNPTTQIEYGLPRSASVLITIYDVLGREVAVLTDGLQEAGVHRITFDATGIGTGVYYYRMNAGDFTAVRKLLILR